MKEKYMPPYKVSNKAMNTIADIVPVNVRKFISAKRGLFPL